MEEFGLARRAAQPVPMNGTHVTEAPNKNSGNKGKRGSNAVGLEPAGCGMAALRDEKNEKEAKHD